MAFIRREHRAPGLAFKLLDQRAARRLGLPRDHPLAARNAIRPQDFAGRAVRAAVESGAGLERRDRRLRSQGRHRPRARPRSREPVDGGGADRLDPRHRPGAAIRAELASPDRRRSPAKATPRRSTSSSATARQARPPCSSASSRKWTTRSPAFRNKAADNCLLTVGQNPQRVMTANRNAYHVDGIPHGIPRSTSPTCRVRNAGQPITAIEGLCRLRPVWLPNHRRAQSASGVRRGV